MRLDFIENGPALVVRNTRATLVVADLHFGIEADMARHGLHFSSRSRERMERVLSCIRETSPDCLVLLGDVKHNVPITTRQEWRELPLVLDAFRKLVPFRVIPGNHDSGLERFLEPGEMLQKDGAIIDGVGYIHGHTSPSPVLDGHLIIAGHHHPLVSLQDEVGCSLRAPAYLFARIDPGCLGKDRKAREGDETRVLFMPAFNELSGYDIRKIVKDPFSPLSKCIVLPTAEIILTDGTFVGPLGMVEPHERD